VVVQSTTSDSFNCIDPTILTAPDGTVWLGWGSFSFDHSSSGVSGFFKSIAGSNKGGGGGIQIRQLDPNTGGLAPGSKTVQIAERPASAGHAEEAPSLFYKNGFYYLLTSWDYCCWQKKSPYHVMVGRTTSPAGPYVDRDGVPLTSGGGTHVLAYNKDGGLVSSPDGTTIVDSVLGEKYVGIGGTTPILGHGPDKLFAHAYAQSEARLSVLRVFNLEFDAAGWPLLRWTADAGAR
jgi:arabinan endo-1,5-alpha-L-arabinosidase